MAFQYSPSQGQDQIKRPKAPGGATIPAGGDPNQGTSPSTGTTGDPIPNASVYLGQENQANLAYENAKNQLLTQRNSLYHQYGLDASGNVDPSNQYGDYQMLLGSEGSALDDARNASADRGLAGPGLGNQEESSLRFQQGAEQQGFKRQVDQAGADYSSGLIQAGQQKQQAYLDAENQAAQQAYLDQLFTQAQQPGAPATTTTTAAATAKKKLVKQAATIPYNMKVTANKTGASANKRQGIFSIH